MLRVNLLLRRLGILCAGRKRDPPAVGCEELKQPLQDWRLFYYRDGAWYNGLSSNATAPVAQTLGPTAPTTIPDGVRLQLVLPPGRALAGTITRDWVNPTNGGGKS